MKNKCRRRERLLLRFPLFCFLQTFFCQPCSIFSQKITARQDGITCSTIIPSPSLMQQKRVSAELSQASFCSHSKLARLLTLSSWLRLPQWLLCKVSLSDFCCLCEGKSAYFNNEAPLSCSPLVPRKVSMPFWISIALQRSGIMHSIYFIS